MCLLCGTQDPHLQRRRAKPSQERFRRTQKSHVLLIGIIQEPLWRAIRLQGGQSCAGRYPVLAGSTQRPLLKLLTRKN